MKEQEEILTFLKGHYRSEFKIPSLYQNVVQKYSLLAGAIFIAVFFLSLVFDANDIFTGFFLAMGMIALLIFELVFVCIGVKEFANSHEGYFDQILSRVEDSGALLEGLQKYDVFALREMIVRFEHELLSIDSRIDFFLGVIGKAGILPAVVAMYAAYTEIITIALPWKLDVFLMAFVVGMYLGSSMLRLMQARLKYLIFNLNFIIDRKEKS